MIYFITSTLKRIASVSVCSKLNLHTQKFTSNTKPKQSWEYFSSTLSISQTNILSIPLFCCKNRERLNCPNTIHHFVFSLGSSMLVTSNLLATVILTGNQTIYTCRSRKIKPTLNIFITKYTYDRAEHKGEEL